MDNEFYLNICKYAIVHEVVSQVTIHRICTDSKVAFWQSIIANLQSTHLLEGYIDEHTITYRPTSLCKIIIKYDPTPTQFHELCYSLHRFYHEN